MKSSCGSDSIALDHVQAVMRLLETQCGVWELMIHDIPIWWFVRNRCSDQVLKYFSSEQEHNISFNANNEESSGSISRLLSTCSKAGVFGARVLVGMIRLMRAKRNQPLERPILFLSVPTAFRGVKGERLSDIYFDSIRNHIRGRTIVIERTTLGRGDLHSLFTRKDTIPFDWMLLRALLEVSQKLWRAPKIDGWHSLCSKCQGVVLVAFSSEQELVFLHL